MLHNNLCKSDIYEVTATVNNSSKGGLLKVKIALVGYLLVVY